MLGFSVRLNGHFPGGFRFDDSSRMDLCVVFDGYGVGTGGETHRPSRTSKSGQRIQRSGPQS